MSIETKEIGIEIGIDKGTYINTEFVGNNIQLKKLGDSLDGEPIYAAEGYWESIVIDLVDKFKEYDKVIITKVHNGGSNCAILTRTSDDGVLFNEYVATTPEGKVQSPTKRYIQIKLSFFGGLLNKTIAELKFDLPGDVNDWDNNQYIITDGSLKLKKDYSFDMVKDESWVEEGFLFRKKIIKSEFKKINSLNID